MLMIVLLNGISQIAVEKEGPASSNVSGASSPEQRSKKPKEQHVENEQHFPSFSGLSGIFFLCELIITICRFIGICLYKYL